jgi:plastocyanin
MFDRLSLPVAYSKVTFLRVVAALLLSGVTATVLAADVRGQIVLGSYRAPEESKPPRAGYNWEIENGVKEVARTRVQAARELAVVLVGAGDALAPDRVEVAVSGGSLLPSTIVVRAGTTVRVRNDDEIGHEVYAEGLDGFGPEPSSPKAIRSVNLQKAGSWPLRDRLTPHARGQLHVLPNLIAIAKVEASGSYAFSEIKPGKYTLQVFHGPDVVASKEIEVGDKALTVDPLTLTNAKAAL